MKGQTAKKSCLGRVVAVPMHRIRRLGEGALVRFRDCVAGASRWYARAAAASSPDRAYKPANAASLATPEGCTASNFCFAASQRARSSAFTAPLEMRSSTGSPSASRASLSSNLTACSMRESPSGSCPARINTSPLLTSAVADFRAAPLLAQAAPARPAGELARKTSARCKCASTRFGSRTMARRRWPSAFTHSCSSA